MKQEDEEPIEEEYPDDDEVEVVENSQAFLAQFYVFLLLFSLKDVYIILLFLFLSIVLFTYGLFTFPCLQLMVLEFSTYTLVTFNSR